MNKQIDVVRKTRRAILNLISDMSTEELNQVPAGFNNNIIWNIAHLVAAQDNIFYVKSGHPLKNISQEYFDAYKPGSKPEGSVSSNEIERIKALLFSSLDHLESDFDQNLFSNYPAWTTRYGVDIESANDGLILLPFHEGLHFGYMMAQKRVIRGQKQEI
ncbi:DinB family protein [Daejeonella lutea]|uniref:DinB superfamily protein n=1 Tax=Daejeonella lutea TaxID=572036 RepID=A0A1T5AP78_9SPHI|nr:DinB family protein [Daejeonella lutea]SKB36736.1 DinB superfamily protein [Daejeonella lutea]